MTPGARAGAAIEILDAVVAAARDGGPAADRIVQLYFKTRRYAGSKDRRAVRDLVYRAIRRSGDRPESGRAALVGVARDDAAVAALFDGGPHAPAPIADGEAGAAAGLVPGWLEGPLCDSVGAEGLAALLDRAPLDLRVNRLKAARDAVTLAGAVPTPLSPDGLRLAEPIDVEALAEWRDGIVEVQDEGSQLAALMAGAAADQRIVDLCAGAGGKTLALAALTGGAGTLIACDADRRRLANLPPRAARAHARVETRLLDPSREEEALADLAEAADLVLVDAPCSGSGTWRRNPETRWRLTPARLDRLVAQQAGLLDVAARLVRPGGHLVYVVCSLLDREGAGQAEAFLARAGGFSAVAPSVEFGRERGVGRMLDPHRHGTDGFFVARLRRAW